MTTETEGTIMTVMTEDRGTTAKSMSLPPCQSLRRRITAVTVTTQRLPAVTVLIQGACSPARQRVRVRRRQELRQRPS